MKMLRRLALVTAVAALSAPTFAQDVPGPGPDAPKPAEPKPVEPKDGAAAAPAKKERVADPKAVAAYEKYAKLLGSPAQRGTKEIKCRMEMVMMQLGPDPIVFRPHWKKEGEFQCEVDLPESLVAMMPPEQLDMVKGQFKSQFGNMSKQLFADPAAMLSDYDLAYAEEAGKAVVTMTAYGDKAESEKSKAYFGADGLLEKVVATPKVDPNNPQAAMMAGMEIETDIRHEKRGDGYVMSGASVTTPMGAMEMSMKYYDGPGGVPLTKSVEISTPMLPEPMTMDFFDYELDGKAVEATAKPKPAAPAPAAPAPAAPDAPKKEGDSPAPPSDGK